MIHQPPPGFAPPVRPVQPQSKQRIALIVGGGVLAMLLLCCGGLAVVGVLSPNAAKQNPRNVGDQQAASAPQTPGQTAEQTSTTQPAAAPTTSAAVSSPATEKRRVTETREIPFPTKTVNDSSLAKGTQKIRTKGVPGAKTLTYEVTFTNGAETDRKLLSETVTKQPVTQVVAIGTKPASNCDPNYTGACVPIAEDVDCAGGSGNGPAYVRGPVTVVGTDIYGLDSDGDGIGCE